MRISLSLGLLISLGLVMAGCSSIMSGQSQNVTINSNVPGATVIVNGNHVGTTPVTARVKREAKMHYIIKKDGYITYQSSMETKLDPWFWGNVIIGGVLGSTTDFALGTTNKIDPDTLYVELQPEAPVAPVKEQEKPDAVVKPKTGKGKKEVPKGTPTEPKSTPADPSQGEAEKK